MPSAHWISSPTRGIGQAAPAKHIVPGKVSHGQSREPAGLQRPPGAMHAKSDGQQVPRSEHCVPASQHAPWPAHISSEAQQFAGVESSPGAPGHGPPGDPCVPLQHGPFSRSEHMSGEAQHVEPHCCCAGAADRRARTQQVARKNGRRRACVSRRAAHAATRDFAAEPLVLVRARSTLTAAARQRHQALAAAHGATSASVEARDGREDEDREAPDEAHDDAQPRGPAAPQPAEAPIMHEVSVASAPPRHPAHASPPTPSPGTLPMIAGSGQGPNRRREHRNR